MKNATIAMILAVSLVAACDRGEKENVSAGPPATLSGTVSYRERIALSDTAVVEITLQDVSRADAPAVDLARHRITRPGQVPIPFELGYDPADIDERMSYSLRARITDQGKLLFINDTATPVLTRGAGNTADMMLVRVADPGRPPGMDLEGMFRYMADAALFRDCRDNKTYPVSMEGEYIELERAYLNSGINAGDEVMVKLRGRLLERPAMEGNNNIISLIVDKLHVLQPGETCSPGTHAALLDTYWRLDQLGGEKVTTPPDRKEAHMILSAAESSVHGNAGCNNFFSQFSTESDNLSFSAVGSTMMACPEGMDTEQAFLAALGDTARYAISGLFLELYDSEGRVLARFEAVYL